MCPARFTDWHGQAGVSGGSVPSRLAAWWQSRFQRTDLVLLREARS